MFNLKRIVYIPLCLLLFSVSSFSAQMSDGSTGKEISDYASSIRSSIIFNGGGVFNGYKGKVCIFKFRLSRDGSFSFNIENGYPDLCKQLSLVLTSMEKLPPPPSESLYLLLKSSSMQFKP
ncbi:cell envelope integrity TolA C-terminal domain-containing protein [Salmonella enterica]